MSQHPYWVELRYSDTANAGIFSDYVYIIPDGTTALDATATFSTSLPLTSGGVELILGFYDDANTLVGSAKTVTQSMTAAGTEYTITTTPYAPPLNSGVVYCTATLQLNGTPSTDCTLSIFNIQIQNTNNSSLQPVLNLNGSFMSGLSNWSAANDANLQAYAGPFTAVQGAYDSLVIDGSIELMGGPGGVPSTVSELIDPASGEGARFRISAPGGTMALGTDATGFFDLGTPQPTQDIVESLLLDGERPFGRRASNRTLSIPVVIFARTLKSMAAAREYLLKTIDQQVFQITWTPASTGLPMILDCFRATPSVIIYGFNYDRSPQASGQDGAPWAITQVTITVQALPYGRSGIDGVQNLELTTGEIDGSQANSAIVVDNFGTVNSMDPYSDNGSTFQNGGWRKNTAQIPGNAGGSPETGYISANSAEFVYPTPAFTPWPRAIYENLNAFNVDITGYPVMSIWIGQSWNEAWPKDPKFKSTVRMNWTIYDVNGASLSFDVNSPLAWGADPSKPVWTRRTGNIPQNSLTFDYSHVTGYKIIAANYHSGNYDSLVKTKVWLNGVNFYQNSIAEANTPRAAVYNVRGVSDMARSPVSGEISLPAQAPQTVEITQSGTWLVPAGVQTVEVEAWGGGGGGASVTPNPSSGIPSVHGSNGTNQQNTAWTIPISLSTNLNVPLILAIVAGNTTSETWTVTDTQGNTWTQYGSTLNGGNHETLIFQCASPNALVAGTDSLTITATVPVTIAAALLQFPDGTAISTASTATNTGNSESPGISSAIGHNTNDLLLVVGGSNDGFGWVSTASGTPGGANLYNYAGGASSSDVNLSLYSVQTTTGTYNFSTSFAGSPAVGARQWSLMTIPVTSAVAYASIQPTAAGIAGGGGGGGEYAAETAVSVIPGTQVPVTIGAGGQGSQPVATVQEFKSPGTMKWTCPAGVNSILAEAWGGGAAGAAGGGGGGGAMYVAQQIVVVPGKTYSWTIGAGGKANTGTSAADNAARNGGPTRVNGEGSGQWCQAHGGFSPLTGSSSGGKGGYATIGGEEAPTNISGGNGGNSPGAAGGGGGASATETHGGTGGGSSPQAGTGGAYKTGGLGGIPNGTTGGAGGNGANAPGTPTAGLQPGGGGGGGYTSGKNYVGANGGNGMIRVSYRASNGSKTNGGATKFGATGLTNLSVLAHGGATPPDNTPIGGAGATGSSNSEHFNGGTGGMQGGTTNEYMPDRATSLFTNLTTATGTGATFTSSASSSAMTFGTAVVVLEASGPLSSGTNTSVTDSAGNQYTLQKAVTIPGGTAVIHVYTAPVEYPITTSTTLSLNGNTNSITYSAMWLASQFFQTVLDQNIATGTGTGTAVASSFTNPIPGTVLYEMLVVANNGTATCTNGSLAGLPPATTTTLANGTLEIALGGELLAGASTAVTQAATLSASTGWAALSIPFVAANQDTNAIFLAYGSGTAATSVTVTVPKPLDPGSGMLALLVEAPAASTITVADNASGGSNVYTKQSTATNTSSLQLWTAPITSLLNGTTVITVTDGTSQTHSALAYFIPNATAFDSANIATGSGTALSVTSQAATQPGELVFSAFGQTGTSASFSALTSGWGQSAAISNANGSVLAMFKKMQTPAAITAAATTSFSGNWSGISGTFKIPFESGGGGAGAGPNGTGYGSIGGQGGAAWTAGGKGADGVTTAGAGQNAGSAGGAGSGALSTNATGAFQGGQGGSGMIRLTWQPPLRTFNDFIIHRPSPDSTAKFLNPVVDINPSDPPDNREYAVDSLTDGANAQFGGTYSVLLINHTWDSPATSRNVTVTVNQYEYLNGPVVSVQATRSILPGRDVTNGYVDMGPLTLPIKDYDQSVSETYYTVSVHSTDANDRFQDVVFLDTMGQTVLVNIATGTAGDGRYSTYYVDEPEFDRALGQLLGTGTERNRAISVMDMALATGGPLYVEDGTNYILAYSTAGAPNVGLSYSPRWFTDRLS